VVFVDFERDSYHDVQHGHAGSNLHSYTDKGSLSVVKTHYGTGKDEKSSNSQDNLNLNTFSRCLACYPYDPNTSSDSFGRLYNANIY
jgi:hypothetical protein